MWKNRKFEIDNITFNFSIHDESEFLGDTYIKMNKSMFNIFFRERGFISSFSKIKTIPHYDSYMFNDAKEDIAKSSVHNCFNTDTQIVFYNHFFDKKRKYKINASGSDPYWLFHDVRHSIKDVYGDKVNGIYSNIEYERLLEGAELAKKYKVHMKLSTFIELEDAWSDRWQDEGRNAQKFDSNLFNLLTKKDKIEYEKLIY